MAEIPYESIYSARIQRTGEVLNFEVSSGTVKAVSIYAPNVSALGEHIFNLQKNDVDLLAGADRITINTANKRVEKTDSDFGLVTVADGDILTFTVDTLGAGGVQGNTYFIVIIDDGIGGGAADEISVDDSPFDVIAGDDVQEVLESVDAELTDLADNKQDALVSGTNIKTVGGSSLLGSGNVAVGETNTASNVGASGAGVFKQKTSVDFEFRKIKAGTGLSATQNSDDVEIAHVFIGVRAKATANQSIPNNAYTSVNLGGEDFDTDGFHSTSSNTSRITIPSGLGGKYHISGIVRFEANATGQRYVRVIKNGSASVYLAITEIVPNASFASRCQFSQPVELAAGDYIEMQAFQNSGASRNIEYGAGTDEIIFSAYKVG